MVFVSRIVDSVVGKGDTPVHWASGKGQSFPNGQKFSRVLGKHLPASSSLDPYFSAQPGRSPNPPQA
jgi:hypothetical protein